MYMYFHYYHFFSMSVTPNDPRQGPRKHMGWVQNQSYEHTPKISIISSNAILGTCLYLTGFGLSENYKLVNDLYKALELVLR